VPVVDPNVEQLAASFEVWFSGAMMASWGVIDTTLMASLADFDLHFEYGQERRCPKQRCSDIGCVIHRYP
jgi:hypothetical protein